LIDLGGEERIKNISNKLIALTENFNKENINLKKFIFIDTAEASIFLETFKQNILNDFL
jgi:hypothetical protein